MEKPENQFATQDETVVENFLTRIPQEVANSFDEAQLTCIKAVFGAKNWGNHSVDLRSTFRIPFVRKHFYYVILLGENQRQLTRSEKKVSLFIKTLTTFLFLTFCIIVGLLTLYLAKSAAGIDLFPNYSLGIWDLYRD